MFLIEDKSDKIFLIRNSENDTYNIIEEILINDYSHFIEISEININQIIDKNDNIHDIDYKQLNEEDIDIDIEKTNSSLDNVSLKYHLKGIEENETYSTIIDF